MTTWTVEALDRFGGSITPLPNAIPQRISDRLNSWRTATVTIPTTDAGAVVADLLNCRGTRAGELRIKRSGSTLIWGPITSGRASRSVATIEVADPLWYVPGLNFGPIRFNFLTNPNGASGLTGWSGSGLSALSVSTADFVRANPPNFTTGQSFLLTAGAGADSYMRQLVAVTTSSQPVVYTLAGWAKIDSSAWTGPAFEERGLFMARAGAPTAAKWAAMTASTPRDEWVRFEAECTVPANTSDTLDIRPYAAGRVRWGALSLTVYESTGTPTYPEDAIHPFNRVVDYMQDPAWGFVPLNIARGGNLTDVPIEIHYQFNEGQNIWQALLDFTRKGILDFGIVPGTRMLTAYSPRRGQFLPNVLLDIAANGSLADFDYATNTADMWSAIRMEGTGSGPDREVGFATDYSLSRGIRRERKADAPPNVTVADLDRLAKAELGRARAPVKVPTLTTHERSGALIDVVNVGDTATVRIDHGCVYEDSVRRIVGWDLDCRKETMILEVNA